MIRNVKFEEVDDRSDLELTEKDSKSSSLKENIKV